MARNNPGWSFDLLNNDLKVFPDTDCGVCVDPEDSSELISSICPAAILEANLYPYLATKTRQNDNSWYGGEQLLNRPRNTFLPDECRRVAVRDDIMGLTIELEPV
jgi:hypothetical protein